MDCSKPVLPASGLDQTFSPASLTPRSIDRQEGIEALADVADLKTHGVSFSGSVAG
jgi:hypothetical protein